MSEPIKGFDYQQPSVTIKDASVAILYRKTSSGTEVFWLRRGSHLKFAGGYYAFPGGRVDADDAKIAVEGASTEESPFIVSAARELFEETGVLVARGAEKLTPKVLEATRAELNSKTLTFQAMVEKFALVLERKSFLSAGRWVTPNYMPARFDARFFLVEAPPLAEAKIAEEEASEGGWIRPATALHKWNFGAALLHPPNLHVMQVMHNFADVETVQKNLQNPPYCKNFISERLEFQKGVMTVPLKSNTLPPATHTNCYLLGEREMLLVDPGADDPHEQQRLVSVLEELKNEGRHVRAIVLTHHHQDHVSGLGPLLKYVKAPVFAHQYTASRINVPCDRLMEDGHSVVLEGDFRMHWNVLHTPGHAKGHICLVEAHSRCAIVGDMVAGVGTIVIETPEGDMAHYMAQLKRLKQLHLTTLFPAHGPAIADASGQLGTYIAHREMRERRVMSALGATAKSLSEVAKEAYADTPDVAWPLAEIMTQAVLEKLEQERVASKMAGGWCVK